MVDKGKHALNQQLTNRYNAVKTAGKNALWYKDGKSTGVDVVCIVRSPVGNITVEFLGGPLCGTPGNSELIRKAVRGLMDAENAGTGQKQLPQILTQAFGSDQHSYAALMLENAVAKGLITRNQADAVLKECSPDKEMTEEEEAGGFCVSNGAALALYFFQFSLTQ